MKAYTRREENEIKLFWVGYEARGNAILGAIVGLAFVIAKYPSIIIEVFFRKKFGERYFTLSSSIFIFFLFLFVCIAPNFMNFLGGGIGGGNIYVDVPLLLFAGAFLYKSIVQRQEIKKYGVTYKLDRFSLSQGEYHKFFKDRWGQNLIGLPVNSRTVEIFFEPIVPILIGLFFMLIPFLKILGVILFLCGVIMVLRQFGRAIQGRNAVLDIIDQNIVSQDKAGVLMEEKPIEEVHGIRLPVALPSDQGVRQMLMDGTTVEPLSKDTWSD